MPQPEGPRSASGSHSVSVIVPAFNEEKRIGATLAKVLAYAEAGVAIEEVLVVDDGSTDQTIQAAEQAAGGDPRFRVLALPKNRGKGAAVRAGVLASRGAWVLITDADLSTPIEELSRLMRVAESGYDFVIGSRALVSSRITVRQPRFREWMGRGFNLLVQSLLLGGIRDTQCGFKLFSREVAQRVFSEVRLDGYAFDVEALFLARRFGFRIQEEPVVWAHAENSRVSPFSDSLSMARDLVLLRLRFRGRTSASQRAKVGSAANSR